MLADININPQEADRNRFRLKVNFFDSSGIKLVESDIDQTARLY